MFNYNILLQYSNFAKRILKIRTSFSGVYQDVNLLQLFSREKGNSDVNVVFFGRNIEDPDFSKTLIINALKTL